MIQKDKHLSLNDLKVQSFVTSLADDLQDQLRGGVPTHSDGERCTLIVVNGKIESA